MLDAYRRECTASILTLKAKKTDMMDPQSAYLKRGCPESDVKNEGTNLNLSCHFGRLLHF
jgi:hypothetical protein